MESFHGIVGGLSVAVLPLSLLYTFSGVFIGTMISHLPGIGPSAGIALLIPITFGMDPMMALMMLSGIYYGCMYGGAVTAILLNMPGDSAAVMTVLDGYPLARQGRAGAALTIAAVSSFIAGMIGVTLLVLIAAPLARFALRFGPAEFFALMLFALTTATSLSGKSVAKGLIAVCLGLMLSTIGLDLQTGVSRFVFGIVQLQEGISFLLLVVGIFAIAEGARMIEGTLAGEIHTVEIKGRLWFTREDWRAAWPAALRGCGVGFTCGAAPGLGGTIAAMMSYVLEKRISRQPEKFGTGMIQGVAGPEASVNADACGNFAHLLALGIPGSGASAVLMGAFILFGLQPGPMLFQTDPALVWGLIASMYVGNVMLLVLNFPLVGVLARILYIPPGLLTVFILGVTSAGVYSFRTEPLDLLIALGFGLMGYGFRIVDMPKAPLIFGMILGPRIEQSFRQAMTISGGDPMVFIRSPIALGLLLIAAGTLAFSLWSKRRLRRQAGIACPPPAGTSP